MLAALALLATAARGEEGGATGWYGYQTLLVDGAALAAGAAAFFYRGEVHAGSLGSRSMVLGTAAGAAWLCGPAAVHFVHSRYDLGGTSIGLRLGIAAGVGLASLVLYGLAHRDQAYAYAIPAVIGAGLAIAIVVDAVDAHARAPLRLGSLPAAVYAFPSHGGGAGGFALAF